MTMFYPIKLIRQTAGRARMRSALRGAVEFSVPASLTDVDREQTALFNAQWKQAQKLPFYQHWSRLHGLPTAIASARDLNNWPILTKAELRDQHDRVDATPGANAAYTTSGSTSEPFSFPKGDLDFEGFYASMWSYRIDNGIYPFDSFLLAANTISGSGVSGRLQLQRRVTRGLKDLAGNSWKVKGFIATPKDADGAIAAIRIVRPRFVIGYTSALSAIARRASDRGLAFPSLRYAIATSETVASQDIETIRRGLNVKVLVEYGAVELGVIGGTPAGSAGWPIRVNWRHNIVRSSPSGEVLISTLSDRVFPLINYTLDDVVNPEMVTPDGSIVSIAGVDGRTTDIVSVRTVYDDYRDLSARELVYLVRDIPGIESAQVSQIGKGEVDLLLVAPTIHRTQTTQLMAESFRRNHPELASGSVFVRYIDAYVPGGRGKRGVMVSPEFVPLAIDRHSLVF